MLGHLPTRYRVVVWTVGLLAFAGGGILFATQTPVPLMWRSGALLGGLLGLAVVAFFLHGLAADPQRTRTQR